jgi:hypothetical protein
VRIVSPAPITPNRRQHARALLGLPVKLHVDEGDVAPLTVEMVDISEGGARLRSLCCPVRAEQRATLRFLLPDQQTCVAHGRVARVDPETPGRPEAHSPRESAGTVDFALRLDDTNEAFRGFVASLLD